jgi:hypothetical protein
MIPETVPPIIDFFRETLISVKLISVSPKNF